MGEVTRPVANRSKMRELLWEHGPPLATLASIAAVGCVMYFNIGVGNEALQKSRAAAAESAMLRRDTNAVERAVVQMIRADYFEAASNTAKAFGDAGIIARTEAEADRQSKLDKILANTTDAINHQPSPP